MAIIYSYPLNDDIKPLDELVGTTEKTINGKLKTVTRNFLLQDLAEFFTVDGGLQKTITLTTDGSGGVSTLDQVTGVLNIPDYSSSAVDSPITIVNDSSLFSTGLTGTGNNATNANYSIFLGNFAGENATNAAGSNFFGQYAGSGAINAEDSNFLGASAGAGATDASYSNFFGVDSGVGANYASYSNFLGYQAGYQVTGVEGEEFRSNFIGYEAGYEATNATDSNFFGFKAGYEATNANDSNFIGRYAGSGATSANYSNFIGVAAGEGATDANHSNLLGLNAGASFTDNNIGSNNIIIGTNISLPDATANSLNIGGILFGTGTYSDIVPDDPSITPVLGGKIGIGVVEPTNTLHICSETEDTSGLRLERLTSASPTTTGQAIGVDTDGNVVTVSGSGGVTNLSPSQTATNFTINSDTGTGATIPLGDGFLAGATSNDYTTTEKNKLAAITGTNTGDNATNTTSNAYADARVSDAAYDATSWNGVTTVAPSKNAIRDKIESTGLQEITNINAQTTIPIRIIADTLGESLSVYNNNLTPGTYTSAVYGISYKIGVFGYSFLDKAVYGFAESATGVAISGYAEEGIGGEFDTDGPGSIVNFKKSGVIKASVNNDGSITSGTVTASSTNDYGVNAISTNADGISAESTNGNGIVGVSQNAVGGVFMTVNGANIAEFKTNFVLKAFIDNNGYLTAQKLKKDGGTSSQILAADGSVITQGNNITITGGVISSVGGSGGGGSSVNYYLNGGTSQGTFGGATYYEFSKTAVIGTGADFSRSSNGLIASFITDVADPSLLLIPAGNWNLEFFFNASSNGGSPSFYVELYKYDGTTFTLIASSSATPEGITNGTAIDAYFTPLAVPETVLTVNDRLAIRVFVNASSKTITLHTQNGHLCEVITTFTNGLTALNGLQAQVQNFSAGTAGTDFDINSSGSVHTFNLPSASATARGVVTIGPQTFAGDKTFTGTIGASNLSGTNTGDNATNTQYSGLSTSKQDVITLTTNFTSGEATLTGATLNIPQYSGATNLGYTVAPTNGTVTSSTGTSATIPLADATNAGLLKPAKFTVLENTSNTNTGDQDLSGYALLNSPTFIGTPSLPTGTTGTTQTAGDNSTKLATTAFVAASLSSAGVQVSPQDTFGTASVATVTAAQYAAFVTAGTVSSTTLYFITA